MTRLQTEDVAGIAHHLKQYDAELFEKTGSSLRQIACSAAGIPEQRLTEAASKYKVAVIPITGGEGLIPLFVEAVRDIIVYLGYDAIITGQTDVSGIAEGIARGASILFMADDHQFIALNLSIGKIADNGEATGRGFAAALAKMANGLAGKPVLVLGAGPVGMSAVSFLQAQKAEVAVYEVDQAKVKALKDRRIKVESQLTGALGRYSCIIDATPQGEFIHLQDLHPDVLLACPGIPLGLAPAAQARLAQRVIHDPLQIGVATMLAAVIS